MKDQEKDLYQTITGSLQETKEQWSNDFNDTLKTFNVDFFKKINWKKTFELSTPSMVTLSITVVCLCIIFIATVYFFNTTYGDIVQFLTRWGIKLFEFTLPLLAKVFSLVLKLVSLAMTTLWIPSIIYVGIHILVKSQWLRSLLSCTILSLIYLFILRKLHWDLAIFGIILDVYFFILLMTPRLVWRWMSGPLVFLLGLILAMLPNIPLPVIGGTVDFGVFSSFFIFLFFFLHNLASFIKLFAVILGNNINLQPTKTSL